MRVTAALAIVLGVVIGIACARSSAPEPPPLAELAAEPVATPSPVVEAPTPVPLAIEAPTPVPTAIKVAEPPPAAPAATPVAEARLESAWVDEVLAGGAGAAEVQAAPDADEPAAVAAPGPAEAPAENPCDRPPGPMPAPGSPGSAGFWQSFRTPFPPTAVWNPPGPKRVGLQVGHWRLEELPEELARLGGGSYGGGKAEWEVNLDVAQRAALLLEQAGVQVDILPATIPPRYRAHAFLSIHADGDTTGRVSGYKLARPSFSATPEADDRLLAALYDAYGQATGLPRDDAHISRRMTAYYAFNSRRYCHAVAPGVPSGILEMGFLTSAADRQVLLGNPDAVARGVAVGLLRFLGVGG